VLPRTVGQRPQSMILVHADTEAPWSGRRSAGCGRSSGPIAAGPARLHQPNLVVEPRVSSRARQLGMAIARR
jgi:hypothetical protein